MGCKKVELVLDAGEGLGSQMDHIIRAIEECGIQVEPDKQYEGSDTFGYVLTPPEL